MVATKKTYPFEPDYAVPPGRTLASTLECLGMTQAELALRTGLTTVSINRIIKGEQPITAETANRLELVTGVPASLWNNLEAQYREQLAKIEEREQFKRAKAWRKSLPVKELMRRNVIPNTKDEAELVRSLLRFYGVSSVAAHGAVVERHGVASRRSQKFKSDPIALDTWLRLGELEAARIECRPYSLENFKAAVQRIRSLTNADPSEFVPTMVQRCAEGGVALALIPEMPKAPWYGASKWLTPTKALILLSLRGKRDDQFWFSFFHEAGHILHDGKKELFTNDGSTDDPCEQRANDFAATLLIPKAFRDRIRLADSELEIKAIATELEISPGIVVGQFQHMTGQWNKFNHLKRKFDWQA